MKIIILAAGKGERLMPLTMNTPKSLLYMANGKTLLEEQIERIAGSKAIDEIVLVVGYLADQIEAKIQMHIGKGMKIKTVFNPFYDKANNLVSLWAARGEMNNDFLIANGDCIFPAKVFSGLVKNCAKGIFLSTNRKKKYDAEDMKVRLEARHVLEVSKGIDPLKCDAESPGLALVRGDKYRKIFIENMESLLRDRSYLNRFWLEVFNHLTSKAIPVSAWPFYPNARWQEIDFHMDVKSAKDLLRIKDIS
ncbi:MAG TPA: sugar phosphate nucleotidyltransferase [Candidatus Omnitrophota bacterium]|nr:sugar phosphate nucleotidyltransferase [Candidatus Omnitrophota bacterium]